MITIGLTGNIASGKSMVSQYLQELGAKIIDADLVAREIVEPGSPALKDIKNFFGEEVINLDGSLNRKILGSIVFANQTALEKLNQITHPKIREAIGQKINDFKKTPVNSEVIVIDAPLLIEVDLHQIVDQVWVVQVDQEIQLQRLISRNKLSEKEATQRISSQLSQKKKLEYADKIIPNNGSPKELRAVVSRLWNELMTHV